MYAIKSLCVLGVFFIALGSYAEAQPKNPKPLSKQKTAQLFEEASNLFKIKEYEKALSIFKELYLSTSEPALLFNIAQCQKNLGQLENALQSYQAFIRDSPENPLRANAEARIAEIQEELRKAAALGAITISSKQDPASVFLDGESKGPSPLTLDKIKPGQHVVRVEKEGFLPSEFTINVIADQTLKLEMPMLALPPTKTTESLPFFASLSPKLIPKLLIGSVGTGAAGLALGGLAVVKAHNNKVAQNDPNQFPTGAESALASKKARNLAIASDALFVLALVSGGTVIMYKKQTKKTEVSLSAGLNGALLSVGY